MEETLYDWRKRMGLCVQCGKERHFPGYVRCPECIEKAEAASRKCWGNEENKTRYNERGKKRKKELRHERKEKGLCPGCGKQVKDKTYVYCARCRERKNAARRAKNRRGPGDHFRERIEAGVCMFCGGEIVPGYKLCKSCLERSRKNFKACESQASKKWRKEIGAEWGAKKKNSGNG